MIKTKENTEDAADRSHCMPIRICDSAGMSYPPAKPPMKYSLLAGKEVSTWSDLWKHECEVSMLAAQPLAKRNEIFDEPGKGMKFKRGDAAVTHLRVEVERYAALKRAAGG